MAPDSTTLLRHNPLCGSLQRTVDFVTKSYRQLGLVAGGRPKAQPKRPPLVGYAAIFEHLEREFEHIPRPRDARGRRNRRDWLKRYGKSSSSCPIWFRDKRKPIVDPDALTEWWSTVVMSSAEVQKAVRQDREFTTQDTYLYGRQSAMVVPEISGSVRLHT